MKQIYVLPTPYIVKQALNFSFIAFQRNYQILYFISRLPNIKNNFTQNERDNNTERKDSPHGVSLRARHARQTSQDETDVKDGDESNRGEMASMGGPSRVVEGGETPEEMRE